MELPENVNMDKIGAEVRDGVLYLTIPKLTAGARSLTSRCSEVKSPALPLNSEMGRIRVQDGR